MQNINYRDINKEIKLKHRIKKQKKKIKIY